MPFELILTRDYVPGIGRRLESQLAPLSKSDFELIMDGAPIRRRLSDGSCWLWHPENMAWLQAKFHEQESQLDSPSGSYISFSISYSHLQYLKVWADAFELALRLARHLQARVFEDWHYQELSNENVDDFLAPESAFVKEQIEFWKKTIAEMDARMYAPLEYPFNGHDAVNDYFVFFLEPEAQFVPTELISKLDLCVAPESVAADRFVLKDRLTDSLLSRVLLRQNDRALQISPFYWMEPFSTVASQTLSIAKRLQTSLGGKLYFRDRILDEGLTVELEQHCKGLGVEFFLFNQGGE